MKIYKSRFKALGGPTEIHLAASSDELARQLVEQAMGELERFEAKYSRYRAESWVSRLNNIAGTGQWLEVDSETKCILNLADAAFEESGGLVDITTGALTSLWNFELGAEPEQWQVDECLNKVGWDKVERLGSKIRLPVKGMAIDLGGIGKEFAADNLSRFLNDHGVKHGMVNLAGDISIIGPPPHQSFWTIGIQHPRDKDKTIASINLNQGGLATSGDYERFFDSRGTRFTHILNPRSGIPVTYWQSVTVRANSVVDAGLHATLTMLRGADGLDYLRQSGLRFLAIDLSGNQHHR